MFILLILRKEKDMKAEKTVRLMSVLLAVAAIMSILCTSAFAADSDPGIFDDVEDFVGTEPEIEYSAKDANTLKRVIAGELELSAGTEAFNLYDINGDGVLNAKDVNMIKRVIAGEIVL